SRGWWRRRRRCLGMLRIEGAMAEQPPEEGSAHRPDPDAGGVVGGLAFGLARGGDDTAAEGGAERAAGYRPADRAAPPLAITIEAAALGTRRAAARCGRDHERHEPSDPAPHAPLHTRLLPGAPDPSRLQFR